MAFMRIDGVNELTASLDRLGELPAKEMLNASANVVVAAQKRKASVMLQGPYNKDAVMNAITKGKFKKSGSIASIKIEFPGTQHSTPIGRIAYVNEYGKTNQPARPFIATANKESEEEAESAAMAAYDAWLKTKGL